MRRDASRFADVELSFSTPSALPAFVAAMAAEWGTAFSTCRGRYTTIGSISGLEQSRAAMILEGVAMAARAEAAAFDSALGTNASRLFPIGSASIPQRAPDAAPIVKRRRNGLPEARKARSRAWDARIATYARSLAELSGETGISEGRVQQIIRSGAYPTPTELSALVAVLGEEP